MPLAANTRLGTYKILAPLGSGGMGEVYRARDTKLDRDVAIKVLPRSIADVPAALERFEREAKAVAALSHPNLLAIYDFGAQKGVVYAVMELLEGETLRARLDKGLLPQKQAVDYALQIAKGLSAAHERGVVHRDLKPENVFVTKDGHVKILDFGLAKRVEAVSPDEVTSGPTLAGQTEPGTMMGTMGYMSPEQVRGLPVDHRSDVFSFGAVFYELLTGRPAFKKGTSGDTLAAILRDDAPEPSGSGREISPSLDRIVGHCLEKDRDNRFQSAKDIVFALSEPSSSSFSSGITFPAPKPAGKHRAQWIAVPSLLLVALAVVALLLWRRPPAPPTPAEVSGVGVRRLAVLPFENLGAAEDDYFTDGIADEVRGKLTSLPGIEVIARGSSTPYKKTTKTPSQIAEELAVGYILTATVRWEKSGGVSRVHVTPELVEVKAAGAPTAKWQQRIEADLQDVFQVQSDIATRVAEALGMALGAGEEKRLSEKPTENVAAYDAFLKGEEASNSMAAIDPPSIRRAIGHYEQAVAEDPGFLLAWSRLSHAASTRYSNAVPTPELANRAKEAAERAVALAPNRPEGYLAMGIFERVVRVDLQRALEHFAHGLRLEPGNADILRQTAITEMELGHWDSSIQHLRQTQRLDPRSVIGWTSLGNGLLRMRRYSEAREAQARGLALAPGNLRLIEHRAMTYLGEGDLARARATLEDVPRDLEATALVAYLANYNDLVWALDEGQRELLLRMAPSAFDDDRGTWAMALAQAYALQGDTKNVRAYAEVARKVFAEQLSAVPNDAGRRVSLGLSLAYLGRKDDAIREGERGTTLEPVSKNARSGAYYQHQLARIYLLVGEPEKAIDRLEELLKIPYYISPGWLRIDPNFDSLRDNPRFKKLVEP